MSALLVGGTGFKMRNKQKLVRWEMKKVWMFLKELSLFRLSGGFPLLF